MRVRVTGELVGVGADRVELAVGDVVFEALVSPAAAATLAMSEGERLTLHTREVYESQGQGSSFVPRLLGFTSEEERALFELLTTVKGLGSRKVMRCMAAPTALIARAIAEGDTVFLKTLPEIGKRTAESIVLDLREKVGTLIGPTDEASSSSKPAPAGKDPEAEQAVSALMHLGEQEAGARDLVRRALEADARLAGASADAILASALAVRS